MNLTTTATHDCAVPECGKRIAVQYRLCSRCWRKLPLKLREEVRTTIVAHNAGVASASDLAAAVARAVEAAEGGDR